MKKLILSAFCLGVVFTSVNVMAANHATQTQSVSFLNDERKVIKNEELPEGVQKTLATEAYTGWTVKEAAIVNKGDATTEAYYEVTLAKEKETKTVKFQKDGSLLN